MAEIFNPQYNSNPKQVDINKEKIEELEDAVDILSEGVEELGENKQDKLIAGQNITLTETPEGVQIDATDLDTNVDVQIDGTSIVNNKVANIKTINNNYNESTNKIATQDDLQSDCVQKVSSEHIVYGRGSSGETTYNIDHTSTTEPNYIVKRTMGGNVKVPQTPSSDDHAASKKYVDDAVAGVGGGGLEELTLDTIDFSTFFSTHDEGLYLLSTSNYTTQLSIVGTDPNNTWTIFSNPNQKMLMSVNKNYAMISSVGAQSIKWNGITIFQLGGTSNILQFRERVDNSSIFITDECNNIGAKTNFLEEVAFKPLYETLDLATFYNNYLQYNNNMTFKPFAYGSDFIVYIDEGQDIELLRLSEEETKGALILAYGDSNGNVMCINIICGNGRIDYINCDLQGNLYEHYSGFTFTPFVNQHYKHNINFSFDFTDNTAPMPNTYSVAGSVSIFNASYSNPISSAQELRDLLLTRNGSQSCSGSILINGVPAQMLSIGISVDYEDPTTYPDGLETFSIGYGTQTGTPVSALGFSDIEVESDLSNTNILSHITNFVCDDHVEQI